MKQISSTKFARAYPRLTEPHEVTALGRPIGMWIPTGSPMPEHLSLDAADDFRYKQANDHRVGTGDRYPEIKPPDPGKKR